MLQHARRYAAIFVITGAKPHAHTWQLVLPLPEGVLYTMVVPYELAYSTGIMRDVREVIP